MNGLNLNQLFAYAIFPVTYDQYLQPLVVYIYLDTGPMYCCRKHCCMYCSDTKCCCMARHTGYVGLSIPAVHGAKSLACDPYCLENV